MFNKVKLVTGLKVELTTKGPGKTAATTTPQDATIEFYELPSSGDKATSERLIATLAFKLTVDAAGGDPKLDGDLKSPTNLTYAPFVRGPFVKVSMGGVVRPAEAPDLSSDFWLDLELPQAVFNGTSSTFNNSSRLHLPWESEDEKNVLEIGAKLTIAGTVESDIKANNIVSVRLDHTDVPRDGNGPEKDPCVGVGMVYPTVNHLWDSGEFEGAKKAAKMVAKTINVFLHDEIVARHAPVTLSEIATRLGKIFVDAGLPKPTVTEKTDADIRAAGFERRTTSRGKRWGCNAAKMVDPEKPLTTSGLSIDFFDFWLMWEPTLTGLTAGESAESESIMDFDPTTSKKMLLFPAAVLPESVKAMKTCNANHPTFGATEYQANYVAWILAHEIGHGLGLEHGLRVDARAGVTPPHPPGTYHRGAAGHYDIARGVMALPQEGGGVWPLNLFGPVHKAVLARRFR